MLIVIVRTIVLYCFVAVSMRVMGKREIGQLQPYELVIAIMISELAAVPMGDTGIPLINGITPIITLLTIQVILSFISMKSLKAREIICGTPSILIRNGKIIEQELQRLRYNLSDLLEQLRAKNVPNISDIEFAILETSGQLSVIPKSQKRPVIPEDLELSTKYEGLPHTLIIDGQVQYKSLRNLNLNLSWLKEKIRGLGIEEPGQILFASLDTQGNLYCQEKASVKGGQGS